MRKNFLAAISLFLFLCALSTGTLAQGKGVAGEAIAPTYTLVSPRPGTVLKSGTQVTITWEATFDPSFAGNPYAEMELFLVTNEGLNMRITPQLGTGTRSYVWTVPALSSSTARLVLQAGIEADGGDMYTLVPEGMFTIQKKKKGFVMLLNAFEQEEVRPGTDLDISWVAEELDPNSGFDVMISYDRGAHFHKAGTTTETRFTLPIAEDFAGSITVQVVGRGAGGIKVPTMLTRDATVRVRDK